MAVALGGLQIGLYTYNLILYGRVSDAYPRTQTGTHSTVKWLLCKQVHLLKRMCYSFIHTHVSDVTMIQMLGLLNVHVLVSVSLTMWYRMFSTQTLPACTCLNHSCKH